MELARVFLEFLVALFGTLLGLSYFQNLARSRFHWQGQLTPNCLLTRHPILLVPGQRSLFYYRNYYNFLGSYLAEHGYDVFHLHLPWRKNRQEACRRFLENLRQQKKSLHLIGHPAAIEEFQGIFTNYGDVVLSISTYQRASDKNLKAPLSWSLKILNVFHNYFVDSPLDLQELGPYEINSDSCYKNLLHRLQVLAENDYIKGNQNEGRHE